MESQLMPLKDAKTGGQWLTSHEARKQLKVSTCKLAHMREGGEVKFLKQGNAYLYDPKSITKVKKPSSD
jgi:hypothetical protein